VKHACAISIESKRLTAGQWGNGFDAANRPHGPENGLAGDFRSTMPVSESCGKTLPSEAEVMAGVNERLKFWTDDQVRAGLRLILDLQILGIPIDEEAAFELDQPDDRREPWTGLCAVAVLHARAAGDVALFWRAGAVVLQSQQASQRPAERKSRNALTKHMREFRSFNPNATAAQYVEHALYLARNHDDLFPDADEEAGTITVSYRGNDSTTLRIASLHSMYRRICKPTTGAGA